MTLLPLAKLKFLNVFRCLVVWLASTRFEKYLDQGAQPLRVKVGMVRVMGQKPIKTLLGVGFAILLCPFLSVAATAQPLKASTLSITQGDEQPADDLRSHLFWKTRLGGSNYSELQDREQIVKFRLYGLGEYKFHQDVLLRAEIQTRLDSGYSQVVYDDAQTKNAIFLEEAKIQYNPGFVVLEAGALSQDFYSSPLLFRAQTFPGAREGVYYHEKVAGIGAYLEQAIPTAKTLLNQASEGEPMPRLAMESIKGYVHPTDNWNIESFVHRYSFFDLPSAVADQSRLGGNSVSGFKTVEFLYPFQGFVYGIGSDATIWRVRPAAQFQLINNTLADEGKNTGYWATAQLGVRATGRTWVTPRLEIFNIQSDTSPAYYNSFELGHNNRKGFSNALEVWVQPWNAKITGKYIETTPIDYTPLQGPSQTYLIELETDYAGI